MMPEDNPNRVVVIAAVDRSPASDPAVNTAAALAQGISGAELHLLHVLAPLTEVAIAAIPQAAVFDEGRTFVSGVASTAAQRFRGRITAHLAVGDPAREILQLATDLEADVIVVGTHGKKAIERMLVGSVSQTVVKKARCPVVVARAKEYVHSDVPEIEPPCPECLATQRASKGDVLWCEQHARRRPQARLHYETPQGFAQGSLLIRADQP